MSVIVDVVVYPEPEYRSKMFAAFVDGRITGRPDAQVFRPHPAGTLPVGLALGMRRHRWSS